MPKQSPRQGNRIFVTGHRRPDTDSAVSACVAARLKGCLDASNDYEAILLDEPNRQTQFVFAKAGIAAPEVRNDIRPTVGETMNRQFVSIRQDAHLAEAVDLLHSASGSLIPVLGKQGALAGVLSDRLPQSRYFYNFNPEDYLGHLIYMEDAISAIGLRPLGECNEAVFSEAPGCFRLGCVSASMARARWSKEDVVLCGACPATLALAREVNARAVILAECDLPEAELLAKEYASLPMFYFNGSLISLVSQLALAISVSVIMERDYPKLYANQLLDDVRELVAHTAHALPVVDSEQKVIGTLSRADLLEEKRPMLILVDHFERNQSVCGIEHAEIQEIIDHHRVGNIETLHPVRVDCRPVGSTASILAAQYAEAGLTPSRGEAILLLGALISDTLLLTSPTATPGDSILAAKLAEIAGVNLEEFGRSVLRENDELATASPADLVEKDLKEFQHGAVRFSASQIETVDLGILTARRTSALAKSLDAIRRELGVAFSLLMVTDVFKGESHVILSDENQARAGVLLGGPSRKFAGMVSRKKQLLPMILGNLEVFTSR